MRDGDEAAQQSAREKIEARKKALFEAKALSVARARSRELPPTVTRRDDDNLGLLPLNSYTQALPSEHIVARNTSDSQASESKEKTISQPIVAEAADNASKAADGQPPCHSGQQASKRARSAVRTYVILITKSTKRPT